MKFEIKGPFRENIYSLMRKAGYPPVPLSKGQEKQKAELEFARPAKGYPRFHLFIKIQNDTLIFNLHLDQKRPIYPVRRFLTSNGVYKGVPAHAGEYDSEVVEKEAERIKKVLQDSKNL